MCATSSLTPDFFFSRWFLLLSEPPPVLRPAVDDPRLAAPGDFELDVFVLFALVDLAGPPFALGGPPFDLVLPLVASVAPFGAVDLDERLIFFRRLGGDSNFFFGLQKSEHEKRDEPEPRGNQPESEGCAGNRG
jgi:hypothetical protein